MSLSPRIFESCSQSHYANICHALNWQKNMSQGSDTGPLWSFVINFTVNIEIHRFYTGNFHKLGLKVGVFAIRFKKK